MFKPKKLLLALFLLSSIVMLGACSTLKVTDDPSQQTSSDPLQGLNRSIYSFNNTADKLVLKPVAKLYKRALPKPVKQGISHFFSNLGEPLNALNNLLQGKVDQALSSTFRFTVNSTVGLLGFFDVATKLDVAPAKEDFGQTFAAWGVKPGPYLMLPLLGPSNLRDSLGLVTSFTVLYPNAEITDSTGASLSLTVVDAIDRRSKLLGAGDVLNSQIDPYSFLKIAVEKSRLNAIYDSNAPEQIEEDFDF